MFNSVADLFVFGSKVKSPGGAVKFMPFVPQIIVPFRSQAPLMEYTGGSAVRLLMVGYRLIGLDAKVTGSELRSITI